MINLATTPPPKHLTINGTAYPVKYDFKVWILVSEILEKTELALSENENPKDTVLRIVEICKLIFDTIPNEPVDAIFCAVLEFYKGYPKADVQSFGGGSEERERSRTFSFAYDLNMIILAIRNQSGIDLSYRRKEAFHWWEFLLEFQSLEEKHYISKIMGYRGYNGDNKELLRLKALYALPEVLSEKEEKELEDFNLLFK